MYHRCHFVRRRVFIVEFCAGRPSQTRRFHLCVSAGGDLLQFLLASNIYCFRYGVGFNNYGYGLPYGGMGVVGGAPLGYGGVLRLWGAGGAGAAGAGAGAGAVAAGKK